MFKRRSKNREKHEFNRFETIRNAQTNSWKYIQSAGKLALEPTEGTSAESILVSKDNYRWRIMF